MSPGLSATRAATAAARVLPGAPAAGGERGLRVDDSDDGFHRGHVFVPPDDSPPLERTLADQLVVTGEMVAAALSPIPRGKAGHRDQWFWETLADLCAQDGAREATASLLTVLLRGRLPPLARRFFRSGRQIPLWKEGRTGIRPAVVSSCLRRLAMRVLVRRDLAALRTRLAPQQFAVGVPGGAEQVHLAVQIELELLEAEMALRQIDIENAHNSFDMEAAIWEMERDPALAEWAPAYRMLYTDMEGSVGGELWLYDDDGSASVTDMYWGGHQGCPGTGPAFALAMQRVLARRPGRVYAFSDDTFHVAPVAEMEADDSQRRVDMANVAVRDKPAKGYIVTASAAEGAALPPALSAALPPERRRTAAEGLTRVLGAPVATDDESIAQALAGVLDDHQRLLDGIKDMSEHFPREAQRILGVCGVRRFQYQLRLVPPAAAPALAAAAATATDDGDDDVAFDLDLDLDDDDAPGGAGGDPAAAPPPPPSALLAAAQRADHAVLETYLHSVGVVAADDAAELLADDSRSLRRQLQLTEQLGGAGLVSLAALADAAYVAAAASAMPALLRRYSGAARAAYESLVAELEEAEESERPWARALRASHARVDDICEREFTDDQLQLLARVHLIDVSETGGESQRLAAVPPIDIADRAEEWRMADVVLPSVGALTDPADSDTGGPYRHLMGDISHRAACGDFVDEWERAPRVHDCVRMASLAGRGTGASTLVAAQRLAPEDGGLGACSALEWQLVCRRALGMDVPLCRPLVGSPCPGCRQRLRDIAEASEHPPLCDHAYGESGGKPLVGTQTYHRSLAAVVAFILRQAGYSPAVEGRVSDESRARPGDVRVHDYDVSGRLLIDVTVVRGLTATALQRSSHQPGDLLARAEQGKRERYPALMDTLPGDRFVPFAVDDYGAVGDHAQMLLEELSYRAQARRAIDIGVHGRAREARRVSQLTAWRALISSEISRVGASITMQAMERLSHPTTHSSY